MHCARRSVMPISSWAVVKEGVQARSGGTGHIVREMMAKELAPGADPDETDG